MPTGTTYKPTRVNDFEASKLNFNAQGAGGIQSPNQTNNIDYLLTDDCLITGAWLVANNGNYGDHASFQVLDTAAGTYTGTPYGVINQFITNWFIPPTTSVQFDMAYPAKIYAGMTLRLEYTSTALLLAPFVAINYKLHKVLI